MKYIYPNLEWYTGISNLKGTQRRCPYANAHRCPRYYSSLLLLGREGITTQIRPDKSRELDELWDKSDLLPVVAEHDTSITNIGGKTSSFSNFCPEISFDVFGLFAVYLRHHSDEIDKETLPEKDWRYYWANIKPLHYLNCQVYSQISSKLASISVEPSKELFTQELIEVKPTFMGISLNIKVLVARLCKRWLSKQRP